MSKVLCKDFEIKSFRIGSQVANGKEYAYKIIYKSNQFGNYIFYTKESANKFISNLVKTYNKCKEVQ